MKFKEYKGLDLTLLSAEVLEKWKKVGAFEKSMKIREGAAKFVFFEGPPSANGMPGIHHVMARSIKDSICRYKTMTGFEVHRRAGWDTHGLPVELGVEKMLGITKEDIGSKISVDEYNAACRREVMKYTKEWVNLTERIGYWVDMNDPYITYDNRYIETLWFLLKKIYDKGLLYKGYTIQPYSPAAGTGLSSHELNQPGCYRDVKDTTCTAQFKIKSPGVLAVDGESEYYFLAWTTTPWTLPSNTALCVGPNIDYVRVLSFNPYNGKKAVYVMASALVGSYFNAKAAEVAFEDYKAGDKLVPFKVLDGTFKGSELVGLAYEQLIPWFNPGEGAFRVIPGDYVTTEDGTGIVHIAPTFGADDAKVASLAGVPALRVIDRNGESQAQVDRQGRFYRLEDLDVDYVKANVSDTYTPFAGRYVKNAYDATLAEDAPTLDIDICLMLKAEGKAFKIEKHVHTYPHCWRTDKPVLYYPLDSWFIKATAVREQMMALNDKIDWKPESTGTGRFGKWLESIQDWNLSRSRYWGTPLPIWSSEDGKIRKCIGSLKELYAEIDKAVAAGVMKSNPFADKGFVPEDWSKENYEKIDLHRPYVDYIVLVADNGEKLFREKDLIDVWFDSGAMPYAQEGLRNLASENFGTTADFIAEGVDQTRGWFYTLHAIHTMISGTPAFKSVISNGLVLDKFGNKMSKRLGNAVDPFGQIDKYGPDAVRGYMLTNSQPWDNLKYDENGVDEVRRKFFGTLYNTYSFFALYANIDGFDPNVAAVKNRPEIDRWILSELNTLIKNVRACYEDYDVTDAGRLIQNFVCDQVSNWYVRLCRKRFWAGEMTDDKLSAYQTLFSVLKNVSLLSAPIAPFISDNIYCNLVPEAESVHFCLMPEADESLVDSVLEEKMETAQRVCSMVLALRRKVNIKVRQPLSKMIIPVLNDNLRVQIEAVKSLILNEVNVKEIEFIKDTTGLITKKIKPNFKTLGKAYGAQMKAIAGYFASMDQAEIAAIEAAGNYTLSVAGVDVNLTPEDYFISSEDMPGWLVGSEGQITVALEINLTPELISEGVARELINRIQNLRKESGFEVTDKVKVVVGTVEFKDEIDASLALYKQYIMSQTLCQSLESATEVQGAEVEWGEKTITISISKI